jgi:hypothetical protein
MTYPQLHMIIDGEKIPLAHRRAHTVVNPAAFAFGATLRCSSAPPFFPALRA